MRALRLGALVVLAGCLDVSVPQRAPPPGAGTIQGTVTYPVPGRATTRPAGGATVTLVGTSRQAVADAESGRFLLEGVTQSEGQLLFSYNADRDGTIEVLQKVLDVSKLGAGRGKSVALGEVVLGKRGAVQGRVLRADVSGPTGHAGTSVFVDRLPLAAVTTDTGEFLLENLPEGPVTVSFFRAGYLPDSVKLEVRSGREESITPVRLKVDPMALAAPAARVTGTLRFEDEAPVAAARVKFLSGAQRFEATTSAAGELESELGQAALYQVLIEADGAQSLILYNVLLLPGANALGTIPLTRGTSTPIGFDGGFNPGTPTIAVIDPLELVVPPGGTGVLSSARSTGQKPVTSRWSSSVADGGLRLLFEQAETKGLTTRFTAPDASVAFNVTLNVTDDRGNTSTATSTVRVGLAPKVSLSDGQASYESGDRVTLEAAGTSRDGTGVTEYLWEQVTGTPLTSVSTERSNKLEFTAPDVMNEVELTFTVRARSEVGILSDPSPEKPIFVRPRGALSLEVRANPMELTWTGAETLEQRRSRFSARLWGAPPGEVTYTWQPRAISDCSQFDAGSPTGCITSLELATATRLDAGVANFVAPPVSLTQTFRTSVTARFAGLDGGMQSLTREVGVRVVDKKAPSCTPFQQSRLTYRLQCDEPVVARGLFHGEDAGQSVKGFSFYFIDSLDQDGGVGIFSFGETVPELDDTLTPSVTDRAGNVWNSSSFDEPDQPPGDDGVFRGPVSTATYSGLSDDSDAGSAVTSTTNPRPMWVTTPASAGGQGERFVLARHTADGGNGLEARSVWLSFQQPCFGSRCHQLVDAGMGAPSEPGPALSSVVADERAFLVTSSTSSPALASVTRGVPSLISVSNMPPLLGLSAVGNELWILGSTDAGALFRQRVDELSDGGFALSQADVIVDGGYSGGAVDVFANPSGGRVAAGVSVSHSDGGGAVYFLEHDALQTPSWSDVDSSPLDLASGVRGTWLGPNGTDVALFTVSSFSLRYSTSLGRGDFSAPGVESEIDSVRYGDAALVTWVTSGARQIGLALIGTGEVLTLIQPPTPGANQGPRVYTPRLAVMNGEVLLTWSEMLSPNGPWVIRAQVIH